MTPDEIEAMRRRVVADRRAQGLADEVTEPGVLQRVALVISATNENGTSATEPRSRHTTDHPSSREKAITHDLT